jgi:DNA-nicking Smr family endonuclease
VYSFIHECLRYDVRSALITHGKGQRNKDQIPLLKSFLARWLPLFPEVMAFHSAQKWHGGAGAVYVLLRKSEKAKAETRERLGLSAGKPEP